jgi:hypothetical protein
VEWHHLGCRRRRWRCWPRWLLCRRHPPAGAEPGWLWWSSAEGILYVWYDDGDTQQWVEANPGVPGPAGPTVISADANNASKLGSDGFIYTPAPAGVIVEVGFNFFVTRAVTGEKIMQCWGSPTVETTGTSIVFPKTFASNVGLVATPATNSSFEVAPTVVVNNAGLTGAQLFISSSNGNLRSTVNYSAIGLVA